MAKRIPWHSKEELNAVAVRAKTGDAQASAQLAEMMRPYVVAILRKRIDPTRYSPEDRRDLDQAAWVGVWLALDKFDPNGGTKFSTHAHLWIQGEVSEWLARNSGGLPMPRTAWNFASKVEREWHEQGKQESVHSADDETLAAIDIEVIREGESRTMNVPYAGQIFRARKSSYDLDPDLDARHSPSAEDVALGLADATFTRRSGTDPEEEARVLAFVGSLEGLDAVEWPHLVAQFADDFGLEYERLYAAVMLYTGGP